MSIEDWDYHTCHHGHYHHPSNGECGGCEDEIDARGGIDKCLNCGRYKFNDQLNEDQVCIRPCRNPNEY